MFGLVNAHALEGGRKTAGNAADGNNAEIDAVLNSKDINEYKNNVKNYTVGNYVRGVE